MIYLTNGVNSCDSLQIVDCEYEYEVKEVLSTISTKAQTSQFSCSQYQALESVYN